MPAEHMSRREFVGWTTASLAGRVLGLGTSARTGAAETEWDPNRPPVCTGQALVIQPVLMFRVAEKREATSWKSWGGVQTDETAAKEARRISQELNSLTTDPGFPVKVLPVVKVKTTSDAAHVHKGDYDAVILYAASGSGDLLRASFAPKKDRDTIIFVRHSFGPVYYWYEALSTRYLRTGRPAGNSCTDHGGPHVDDVVVDDHSELLWRLRVLYALKNFVGARIVALGGPWGKYAPEAPQVAHDKYQLHIIDVSYEDITARIQAAMQNSGQVAAAQRRAEKYLALPDTTLMTDRKFVTNAFLLQDVLKDLMREHDAPAFTIRGCMGTILPIAQTTPCLTLSVLNDEGLMAFCESDFVIIPAGILLHYICGRPVFLHNSTFPHDGIVTCAHCTAPRRFDGTRYEPARIMTHYESEYGAAPKVEMPLGRRVTFIDPEYATNRWLGFTGIIRSNPFYEICRSQQDVEIEGDWQKLVNEVRDSHWMMACGDHLKELACATRKLGIQWVDLSRA